MSNKEWYKSRLASIEKKIETLNDELDDLQAMKKEVDNRTDEVKDQITKKRKTADSLTNLSDRLPLVRSLSQKVKNNMGNGFRTRLLINYDEAEDEVKKAINKVKDEISEQKRLLKQTQNTIDDIEAEEYKAAKKNR